MEQVHLGLGVRFTMEDLARLSREQQEAVLLGIAQVIAASKAPSATPPKSP